MTTRLLTAALATSLALAASAASAQSYTAPAGIPAVTAPGGLTGRAALPNLAESREGRAIVAPRRGYEGDLTTGSVRRSDRAYR